MSGTGPGGRISAEDVLDHAKSIVIAYDSHTSIKIGQVIAKVDGGSEAAKKAPVEKKTEKVKKEKQPQKDDIKPVVDRSEKKDRAAIELPS